ncbi:MAG: ATP-dependent RNA helicase HrpA [Syntrophales bacterium]
MFVSTHIKRIENRLHQVLSRDREVLAQRIKTIRRKSRNTASENSLFRQLDSIEQRIEKSIGQREKRLAQRPEIIFPAVLPITGKRNEIVQAIQENQVVIISGDTGSGKSTQIPKMCLEAGRGISGLIGCTQPRRIAATTIAQRIAQELGEELGVSVGYKIRFRERTSQNAYIKIMTDGILLMETQNDPRLMEYDTIIIDEAHERSLNIDFLLGILKTLLPARPDLKLIITSATLDTEKFSKAFDAAPLVHVGGRMFPVEEIYMPLSPEEEEAGDITYVDMAVQAVSHLRSRGWLGGDILIFMPTEQDIMETCEKLEGRGIQGTTVLPLFARLSGSEQGRVYTVTGRKIVVATNVAETSLTIPGIKYVIDTGFARISRYLPTTRTTSLPISPISRSSADQRKGRCGRVQNGICIRLFSREDYDKRPEFTPPEIMRSNLAEVILRMIFLNLGDIASFPFVDRPHPRSIKDGFDLLLELGAVERKGKRAILTGQGRIMARMPLDPRISRMILEAQKEGCVEEVTVIAAALSTQDPRERPVEKAAQADQVHAPFKDVASDFITLFNIWNKYHRSLERLQTQNRMRKFCKEHFLSFNRMREWIYVKKQISLILKEQRIAKPGKDADRDQESYYDRIHRSILSGFLSNIAMRKDRNIYQATRGREVMIFPGSGLFKKDRPWIVAAEMVKTSRLFARTAAGIDPQWLEALGGTLCKRSYSSPHWEKNRGEVRAMEQVSLFGLPIVTQRPVSYGHINPKEAQKIFVQSALVEGQVREPLPFLAHNQDLVKKISELEDKVRRRDFLAGEVVLAEFYEARLEGICDIRTLRRIIKDQGGDDFLRMKESDLMISLPDESELALYPDHLSVGLTRLDFSYKFAPGKPDDGVTVNIQSSAASQLPAGRLEWGVPGLLREKVTALIRGLPKAYRKQLVPVPDTVDVIMKEMKQDDPSLIAALAQFVYERFDVDVPASVWSAVEIPDHLKMRISLRDHRGKEVASGRDPGLLKEVGPGPAHAHESKAWTAAKRGWEKTGLTTWDFGWLPESIAVDDQLVAYPALEDATESVNIRLFPDPNQALASHKKGVQAFFLLYFKKDLRFLKKNLTLPQDAARTSKYFGGTEVIEQALYENLLSDLFQKNIRSREEFDAHARALAPLAAQGKDFIDETIRVMDACHETRSFIYELEKVNKANSIVTAFCAEIRQALAFLVPENFLEVLARDRFIHIPRYLKALRIRVERFTYDHQKDQQKSEQAQVFVDDLGRIINELPVHVSPGKKQAVEEFRWMVEEFKVSLFAQELKTAYPVSEKRLKAKLGEIERMV